MSETAEQQRQRMYEKRKTKGELVKCLECDLEFIRVGSHAVQVHGYKTALEYRRAHGLMARETVVDSHREEMRTKARNIENLKLGKPNRYFKGGDHGQRLRDFWQNRRNKQKGN